jgi:predicted dinucleotide-binding enzyme
MNITIIGKGKMAQGIGGRMLAGGHSVAFAVKDVAAATAGIEELAKLASGDARATVEPIGGAVAEVVVLAVPYGEVAGVVANYGAKLDGKVVIDITNPIDFATFKLIPAPGTSGAEELARLMPDSKVVKAFNTVLSATLATGRVGTQPLDVLVAGDDVAAKTTVAALITDGGMRALDAGPLAHAQILEGLALLHISLQPQLGGTWNSAITFLT